MRGRHGCGLCPWKGRVPIGQCSRCGDAYCARHGGWSSEDGAWLCNRCAEDPAALMRTAAGK